MKEIYKTDHKFINIVQGVLILLSMGLIVVFIAHFILGLSWTVLLFLFLFFLILLSPSFSPELLVKTYGAKELYIQDSPELYGYLKTICARVDLENIPKIYYIDGDTPTAFTTGNEKSAVIVLSKGILKALTLEEIVSVMAHEVAHIINRDLWLMSVTDAMTNMTKFISIFGQGLVVVLIPFYFFSDLQIPWIGILILAFSPLINSLLQLSFSRVREYNADLSAAYIVGTGRYLANALEKLEYPNISIFSRVFRTKTKEQNPSLLRTHPPTFERVKKLRSLEIPKEIRPIDFSSSYHYRRVDYSKSYLNKLFSFLHSL